ncbi:hypothetical protein J2857_006172 [Neorhizobium galegae]|uniref:hypothetical protein n=1 Tax=Neorhizobium galegae TaxID=399 RepID=UPI001AE9E626|nr:hypothetical protein [Neorhizobium galegae]MBP2563373.1 hypothetical protein [Neorhizobium galegae]
MSNATLKVEPTTDWESPYPGRREVYAVTGAQVEGSRREKWFLDIDREKLANNVLDVSAWVSDGLMEQTEEEDFHSCFDVFDNEAVSADRPELSWTIEQFAIFAHQKATEGVAADQAMSEAEWRWQDFSGHVDAEAKRLFQIEALPRDWFDRVSLGFDSLDEAEKIDADRRKAAAEALAQQLGDYHQFPHNPAVTIFDAENPGTVHDVLFSWATGHLSDTQVIEMLHLDADENLDEIARNNRVPQPKERKP